MRHPVKPGTHFDPRRGEPPYWLRDRPEDIAEHRRQIRKHEAVHRQRRGAVEPIGGMEHE